MKFLLILFVFVSIPTYAQHTNFPTGVLGVPWRSTPSEVNKVMTDIGSNLIFERKEGLMFQGGFFGSFSRDTTTFSFAGEMYDMVSFKLRGFNDPLETYRSVCNELLLKYGTPFDTTASKDERRKNTWWFRPADGIASILIVILGHDNSIDISYLDDELSNRRGKFASIPPDGIPEPAPHKVFPTGVLGVPWRSTPSEVRSKYTDNGTEPIYESKEAIVFVGGLYGMFSRDTTQFHFVNGLLYGVVFRLRGYDDAIETYHRVCNELILKYGIPDDVTSLKNGEHVSTWRFKPTDDIASTIKVTLHLDNSIEIMYRDDELSDKARKADY
jgi:hypothetical protein